MGEAADDGGDRAAGPGGPGGSEEFATGLRHRRAEIDERIEQLKAREDQLADRLAHGPSSSESAAVSERTAAEAEQHAQDAHTHAAQMHQRSAARHAEAAEVHDRVAEVLDGHGRPERAEEHRRAAEHDRASVGTEERAAEAE